MLNFTTLRGTAAGCHTVFLNTSWVHTKCLALNSKLLLLHTDTLYTIRLDNISILVKRLHNISLQVLKYTVNNMNLNVKIINYEEHHVVTSCLSEHSMVYSVAIAKT